MICPRCKGTNLYREGDEDYVGCYFCGPVFVGVIQGHPSVSSLLRCIDCGAGVTREGNRCKECAGKKTGALLRGDPRMKQRGPTPVIFPKREPVSVVAAPRRRR